MAAALPLPSSNNNKSWWLRNSSSKESSASAYRQDPALYTGGIPTIGSRPKSASSTPKPPSLMTSVTNPKSTSASNAFTSSKPSSKFNLASVIGFGSRSRKQQPVDIQDPPSQVRSLPTPKSSSHRQFAVASTSTAAPNPRLSRGVASSTSGTSRASTDGPLTPADETSPGTRVSYQHSLMTLTDDPFALTSPLSPDMSDRRSSAHSDKSLSRRLMHRVDNRAAKTAARLPVGAEPKRKDSRDRSATLPSRVRSATDASEAYLPLRAVEPPWAVPDPLPSQRPIDDHMMTVRGASSTSTVVLRKSKSAKPALPWSDVRTRTMSGQGSLQGHQRSNSSSSLSKEHLDGSRANPRLSTTSSTRTSVSSLVHSPLANSSSTPGAASPPQSSASTQYSHPLSKTPSSSTSNSASSTPTISTQFPRPPPMTQLPPTPAQGPSSSSRLHLHPSPTAEKQHPLRARSGTEASTSALSFASSLSSLSFNSRPSPQEPPTTGAYDYPSLMNESLPVPGVEDAKDGRLSSSSSVSETETKRNGSSSGSASASGHTHTHTQPQSPAKAIRNDLTPKPPKVTVPGSRPLPSPPVTAPASYKRERALSATSSTFSLTPEPVRILRKQRSFHNTSLQAPSPPPLRHYNSFEPHTVASASGKVRSPPLPPPRDRPPPPPPSTPGTPASKRGSTGKESLASPRRKLFTSSKQDRERKPEPENVDTPSPPNTAGGGKKQTLHHSSSWFDEPPSAPPPSTTRDVAQHIVPPAELLRLGAAWERESENGNGLRMAKSSWGSRESDGSRTSYGSTSSRLPTPRSAGHGASPSPNAGSKLPRSASLFSKSSSTSSFIPPRAPQDAPFAPASSPTPPESYTSLSPPPRRPQRTVSRPPTANSIQAQAAASPPTAPRRTPLNAAAVPRGALIERKPSFLDMSTRQSVSLVVPELTDRGEPERDSFLELSRGMDSIDTIRESIDSVDSFMQ